MKYRIMALLLALVMLLCACGVSDETEQTQPQQTIPEETQDDSVNGVSREQIIAAFQIYPDWVLERDKQKPDFSHIDESVPVNGVYQIHTAEGLKLLAEHPDANFELLWDIDWENAEWTPVGTAAEPFTGNFDGKGFVISNLNIIAADGNMGFFGVNQGQINALVLENVTITANSGVAGGIAAVNAGTITDSSVSGKMTVSGNAVAGGLVGKAEAGALTNSEAGLHIETTATATVGLLGGELSGVTVKACRFGGPMNLKDGVLFTDFAGKAAEDVIFEACLCRDNTNSSLFASEQEQQMRDLVVQKMYNQGTVEWTVDEDLAFFHTSGSSLHTQYFYAGVKYWGVPYTGKSGDMSRFEYCFNEDGTLKDFAKQNPVGADNFDMYMGSDCSAAIYWAWAQISPSTEWRWTRDMFQALNEGCIAIGQYEGADTMTDTMKIYKANEEQVMAESFAKLRRGDAATTSYTNPDNASDHQGHTRMMALDPVIYRDAEGKIDIDQSYVITHEQGDGMYEYKNTSWIIGGKYDLRTMFANYYCPLSCQELIDGEVPECWVTVDNDSVGKAYLTTGVVETNYRLISTTIRIYDEADALVWERTLFTAVDMFANSSTDFATRTTVRSFDIAAFAAYIDEAELESGKTYTYELSAIPGTGDEWVLKTFDFVQ